MSELFNNPAQVEVLHDQGLDVEYSIQYRGVTTKRRVDGESALSDLQTEILRTAKRSGTVVGVVVFNQVLHDVAECGFLVTDGHTLQDASEVELSTEQEKHWREQHRAWKRRHKPSSRRAARAQPEPEHVEDEELVPVGAAVEPEVMSFREFTPTPPAERRTVHAAPPPGVHVRERVPERPQSAPAAPRTVAGMESLMDEGKHPDYATEGWRGGLNMLGLRLPPDEGEKRRRTYVRSIQEGWAGVGHITVVNEKGSSSKTPTALMLAAVLQAHGKGQVVVRDGNPSGNAHERAEYIPPAGKDEHGDPLNDGDLARRHLSTDLEPLTNTQLWDYLHLHTTDHYALLAHHVQHGEFDFLTDEQSDASYQALSPLARAIITDTGNVPWERRDVPVLHRTQQLVVPMLTYADRENGARKTLGDTLESRGGHYTDLVRNALIVIHQAEDNRKHERRAKEYEARWRESGAVRDVIRVPYDEHMASHRLRLRDLHDGTREAMLRLGAGAAEGLRAA